MSASPVVNTSVITATEKCAYWDASHSQWMVSEVLPGTITKVGLVDAWLPPAVWPEGKPPPGMRVSAVRPG